MDGAGSENAQSSWLKVTCGEHAFYVNVDTKEHTLEPPPEGVYQEEEHTAEDTGIKKSSSASSFCSPVRSI